MNKPAGAGLFFYSSGMGFGLRQGLARKDSEVLQHSYGGPLGAEEREAIGLMALIAPCRSEPPGVPWWMTARKNACGSALPPSTLPVEQNLVCPREPVLECPFPNAVLLRSSPSLPPPPPSPLWGSR